MSESEKEMSGDERRATRLKGLMLDDGAGTPIRAHAQSMAPIDLQRRNGRSIEPTGVRGKYRVQRPIDRMLARRLITPAQWDAADRWQMDYLYGIIGVREGIDFIAAPTASGGGVADYYPDFRLDAARRYREGLEAIPWACRDITQMVVIEEHSISMIETGRRRAIVAMRSLLRGLDALGLDALGRQERKKKLDARTPIR